jgi:gamma-glutamyltranspeptidase
MARVTAALRAPEVRARRGVVAAPHVLAADAGLAALRAGGNAVDAAVAAAAAIAVVYPHMNGIGGDNVWLIHLGREGRLVALNAAGRAAAGVDVDAYRARYGEALPTRGGPAALTVPGVVSGWWEAHALSRARLGSPLGWRALLEDARRHAHEGVAVCPSLERELVKAAALFADGAPAEVRASLWPVFHPTSLAGGRCRQRDLAATLDAIAEDGAEAFYRGPIARRLAAAAEAAGSPLRAADLAEHRADWVEPLRVPYRGGEATSFPPPTQGFAALAILALLEGFAIDALDEADYVHLVVEATKLAFEDRDRYLADPAVVDVPVARCLDPARLAERRRRISRRRAMPPGGGGADGGTIAIVAADADGNAVSLIQSLYHEFGSGVVAGDTGVLLQNRGAFFSLDPRHPNVLAPRKRTAHTLIPSMYLAGGRPRLVYGTMGGEGQPQTQAALVTRVLERGYGPQAAVEAPRWLFGRTWGEPSKALRLEGRFPPEVAASLRERGHDVRVVEDWSDVMGHAHLIRIDDDGFTAGSDPRADGAARGW